MSTTYPAKPVSPKQRSFIEKLLAEKDTTGTAYEGWTPDWSRATTKAASAVITYLLTLPKRSATVAAEPEAGIYQSGDHLVRVYLGQKSGTMLAKEIQTDEWGSVGYAYLGTARRVLDASYTRLSVDEVGALGKQFDHCLMCGRRLDVPESVDRGIGPVCAAKYDVADEEIDYTLAIQQREREDDERAYASKPDNQCTPGQDPCGAWNTCTKHQQAYQSRWGRADNE